MSLNGGIRINLIPLRLLFSSESSKPPYLRCPDEVATIGKKGWKHTPFMVSEIQIRSQDKIVTIYKCLRVVEEGIVKHLMQLGSSTPSVLSEDHKYVPSHPLKENMTKLMNWNVS